MRTIEEILANIETKGSVSTESKNYTIDDAQLEEISRKSKPKIKVIGCGGAGCNTISTCAEVGVTDVECYAANTDAQHLLITKAQKKILLGYKCTGGLGAGGIPKIGEQAAQESAEEIRKALSGADLVFISCGLGGGTGTGGAPIIAKIAKEIGALTIAICTLPFKSEGTVRMENALYGLEKLRTVADTVITIPNDKLVELVPRMPFREGFKLADNILLRGIKGVTQLITQPGIINVDFNDLKTIMKQGSVAVIGFGESESDNRVADAVNEAINSPLLDVDISEVTGALINVSGGKDVTLQEVYTVAEMIHKSINEHATIIWGVTTDLSYEYRMGVMIILTGVKSDNTYGSKTMINDNKDTDIGIDII